MMTSRERVIKTLNREPVDRAPRELWAAAVESSRADELAEMTFRYPNDIVRPDFHFPRGKLSKGSAHEAGRNTDAWGCAWQRGTRGAPAQLISHPLADAAAVADFHPPLEIIEAAKPDAMNRASAASPQFVLAVSETRPLDRLGMLRGPKAALADLAAEGKPARGLLAALHDFSCREMEFWAASDVDGVVIRDDWGDASGLILPRQVWREQFRRLYREYCNILHAGDKFVFFQSAGRVDEIFGDLVQIGVDAVHAQLSLMDVEKLGARYRGKVTFWGGIDSQGILTNGTTQAVREEVDRIRKSLDFNCGGLIAQCRWLPDAPFQNLAAFFERWLEPLLAHA
jgi:hypothetical protein